MCSDERNGIPNIIGKHRPLFTFIFTTAGSHLPCPDCTFSFTYSVHESGKFDSDDKLFSLAGELVASEAE
jgi:hypothetical protein